MFEFVKECFDFSPSKSTVVSRFDYLDGFRGFLAVLVVFQHSQSDFDLNNDYKLFISVGNFIGVSGFFALSSFLLTYRLLKDFDKAKSAREECLIIFKYAIKRFFRIYVTFFVYATFIQIDPKFFGGKFTFSSWYSLVTLQSAGLSHLWTIPIEVKFYFVLPFIAYTAIAVKEHWPFFWISSVTAVYFNTVYFKLLSSEIDYGKEFGLPSHVSISMFSCGTFMTILFYKLEKSQSIKFFKKQSIQSLISVLLVFMFFYGFKIFGHFWRDHNSEYMNNNMNIVSGVYWTVFLFLMLVGSPTYLTTFFSESSILKSCGKYSFGIYLLHPIFTNLVAHDTFYTPRTSGFERIVQALVGSYFVAVLFFYFLENVLMNIAIDLCKAIDRKAAQNTKLDI